MANVFFKQACGRTSWTRRATGTSSRRAGSRRARPTSSRRTRVPRRARPPPPPAPCVAGSREQQPRQETYMTTRRTPCRRCGGGGAGGGGAGRRRGGSGSGRQRRGGRGAAAEVALNAAFPKVETGPSRRSCPGGARRGGRGAASCSSTSRARRGRPRRRAGRGRGAVGRRVRAAAGRAVVPYRGGEHVRARRLNEQPIMGARGADSPRRRGLEGRDEASGMPLRMHQLAAPDAPRCSGRRHAARRASGATVTKVGDAAAGLHGRAVGLQAHPLPTCAR